MKRLKSLQRAQAERDFYDYAIECDQLNPFSKKEKDVLIDWILNHKSVLLKIANGTTTSEYVKDTYEKALNQERFTKQDLEFFNKLLNKIKRG